MISRRLHDHVLMIHQTGGDAEAGPNIFHLKAGILTQFACASGTLDRPRVRKHTGLTAPTHPLDHLLSPENGHIGLFRHNIYKKTEKFLKILLTSLRSPLCQYR